MHRSMIAACLAIVASVPAAASCFEYALDDGSGNFNLGPSQFDAQMMWGNYFDAVAGAERIDAVRVSFAGSVPVGEPVTLFVYDDLDDDLDPTNAVRVSESTSVTVAADPNVFVDFPVPDALVSGGFFVAVLMDVPQSQSVARMDPQTLGERSWLFFDDVIDLDDLGSAPVVFNMAMHPFNGTWMVRAHARPAADLDADDAVGFTDLTLLLAAWGPCSGCPEDLDRDGLVGFTDLTALFERVGRVPRSSTAMSTPIRPIYLLADSELLFRPGEDGRTLPETLRGHLETDAPAAAYIGASNGDEPAFYELFVAAMEAARIEQVRMIKSSYSAMDHTCLGSADVILLAGGDVRRGWDVITSTGMRDVIVDRYLGGAVVIGVSAGAVQLGRRGLDEDARSPSHAFETFGLVPLVIDAHDEAADWPRLRHLVGAAVGERGVGIPHGAGLVCHPDHTFEPLRRPLVELHHGDDGITETLLVPNAAGAA